MERKAMSTDHDQFLALLASAQPGMQRFVCAQIPNMHDAEDVLQKATVLLWRKFPEYREGTSFKAWAIQVARYEVLHARRSYARSKCVFTDELIDRIADDCAGTSVMDVEARSRALDGCLMKLSDPQRRIIESHYRERLTFESIARACGRTAEQLRVQLFRLRAVLRKCISDTLGAGASLSKESGYE